MGPARKCKNVTILKGKKRKEYFFKIDEKFRRTVSRKLERSPSQSFFNPVHTDDSCDKVHTVNYSLHTEKNICRDFLEILKQLYQNC